jgi:hypothetical protein
MKLPWILILSATAVLAGSSADHVDGTWKVTFAGPPRQGPKTVGSIVLDLKAKGDAVTGSARIGVWPGEAPIADGKVDGNHISFNATGHLGSTTGVPTCHFEGTIHGDEMDLIMTVTRNPGGPLGGGIAYDYRGGKEPK